MTRQRRSRHHLDDRACLLQLVTAALFTLFTLAIAGGLLLGR